MSVYLEKKATFRRLVNMVAFLEPIYQLNMKTNMKNSQWAFTPKCIQNLCELKKDIGTNHKMSSSAGGKDRVHPFYSRLRSEPAEGMTRTRDKYRVVYTEKQRRGLEKEFNSNKFITHELRARISEELGLSARQIKIWFQNRRAKERRESRKGKYTEQTESNSAKEDCRTHKHSYSSLNDTDKCLTSCRYTGSENISEERQYNSGQCLFLSQTGSPDICENGTTSSRSCIFESRDNQYVTPSVSPSEWGMPTGNTFIPIVDVSPLTGIISIDEELCIRA